jgi:hypothetical protein
MGTIKKGIIGGFSGTVGPVIGSSWKGKPYMKTRPEKVANPRSEKQLDHRGKFTAAIQFLRPLKNFLRAGFVEMAMDKTAYNAAMSYIYHHAVRGVYPDFEIDYPRVLVSQGTLAGAWNPEVAASDGQVHFSWQNNADNMQVMDSDKALLLVYSPALQKAVSIVGGNTRDSGSQSVPLPEVFIGDTLHCYLAFQDSDATAASTSQYLGSIVIQ